MPFQKKFEQFKRTNASFVNESIGKLAKLQLYKTGVINDPHGQAHSLSSREHCIRFKFVLF